MFDTIVCRFKPVSDPVTISAREVGYRTFTGNVCGMTGLFVRANDLIVSVYHPAFSWPVESTIVHGYQPVVRVQEGV